MSELIPCSMQVLTRNNAKSLKKCLDSLTMFSEVIVQDGGSNDGTKEIALSYPNVTWMQQNPKFLDAKGRITDFSSMRNESIAAAKNDWVFPVDADEEMPPELAEEIREIIAKGVPGVWDVFRRFTVNGEPIIYCSAYPAAHIRLFHRDAVLGYTKALHERMQLKPGITVQRMKGEMLIPLPPPRQLQPKFNHYLAMEVQRLGVISYGKWWKWIFLRNIRTVIALTLWAIGARLNFKKGKRMPFAYDLQYMVHSLRVARETFPPFARRRLEYIKKQEQMAGQRRS